MVKNIRCGVQVSVHISVLCVLDKRPFDLDLVVLTLLEEVKVKVCDCDKAG